MSSPVLVIGHMPMTEELQAKIDELRIKHPDLLVIRDEKELLNSEYLQQIKRLTEIDPYALDKPYERKLDPRIDIFKEYQLIKEKKSRLSRWERDHIVWLVETSADKGKEVQHG
jgi:hypothetical protein